MSYLVPYQNPFQQPAQINTFEKGYCRACHLQNHSRSACPNSVQHRSPINPGPCPCRNLAPIIDPSSIQNIQQQTQPFQQFQPPPFFGLPAPAPQRADPVVTMMNQILASHPNLTEATVRPMAEAAVARAAQQELTTLSQQLGLVDFTPTPGITPPGALPANITPVLTDVVTPAGWHQVREYYFTSAHIQNGNQAWNRKFNTQITSDLLIGHAHRFKPTATRTRITFIDIVSNFSNPAGATTTIFIGIFDAPPPEILTDLVRRQAIHSTNITDDDQSRRLLSVNPPRCPIANETYVGAWQYTVRGVEANPIEIGLVTLNLGYEYI